jgi:chitodextrinase
MIWRTALAVATMTLVVTGRQAAKPPTQHDYEPPTCEAGGPYECVPHHAIEFDGTGSYDPDGFIVSYEWSFGDGHTATGPLVTHRYELLGTYTVALLVVDNSNQSSLCETVARVVEPCGDCPPVCDAGGPYYGIAGTAVLFDGSRSIAPVPCIPIVHYTWSFGDGATGVGPQPTHTYSAPTWYDVVLTITDADGASSTCTTTAVIAKPSSVETTTWGRLKRALFK